LPDLAELLAEENSITQVPSEIGQLTGLRMLHLSFNMINSVAEELVKLTRLDDLRIHPLYLDLTTSREDLQHLLHRTTA
jgi:Leucine-rich repeat (LRR) protein